MCQSNQKPLASTEATVQGVANFDSHTLKRIFILFETYRTLSMGLCFSFPLDLSEFGKVTILAKLVKTRDQHKKNLVVGTGFVNSILKHQSQLRFRVHLYRNLPGLVISISQSLSKY